MHFYEKWYKRKQIFSGSTKILEKNINEDLDITFTVIFLKISLHTFFRSQMSYSYIKFKHYKTNIIKSE